MKNIKYVDLAAPSHVPTWLLLHHAEDVPKDASADQDSLEMLLEIVSSELIAHKKYWFYNDDVAFIAFERPFYIFFYLKICNMIYLHFFGILFALLVFLNKQN